MTLDFSEIEAEIEELDTDLLKLMYNKQYDLQVFMKEKRNLQKPPAKDATEIKHEHVLAAIYFSSCINMEWLELQQEYMKYLEYEEALERELVAGNNPYRDNCLEELIDVFHFAICVFIFLGTKEDTMAKLKYYSYGGLESLAEYAGSTSLAVSDVILTAPYKTWKDQKNTKAMTSEYEALLLSSLNIVFNNIMDFARFNLDSSLEEFVEVYTMKNAKNFNRQVDPKLGYISNDRSEA